MEILWLVIGILVGLLVAWWYLTGKCKKKLAEQETEFVNARRQVEQELEQERRAHDATRSQLTDAEKNETAATQRTASLEAEMAAAYQELDAQKAHNAEAADQLRRTVSDVNALKSELTETKQGNVELSRQLEEANAARDSVSDADRSQVLDLEARLTERDREIARLQAELSAAQSSPQSHSPTHSAYERSEGPSATATAPQAPTSSSDDLTRIKGIGRVLQGKLNGLGITTFRQLAEFTRSDIERINSVLDFPGRIEREQWVEQAKAFVGDA